MKTSNTFPEKTSTSLLILKCSLLTIITGIIAVEIISIVRMKPFWLDEWFIINNFKYKEIGGLFFHPLDFNQSFPRVYLVLIKYFSRIFNYNYLSLVLIPFIVQLLNIGFLYYVVLNIVYKNDKFKSYIFILIFLSYPTTIGYFTQVKQYSMEMFCTLLAVWQFHEFSRYFKNPHVAHTRFWIATCIFLVAPFFSQTYPIMGMPLIICLFFTFLFTIKKFNNITKTLLPIILFNIAVITVYHIEIKYTLSSEYLKDFWHKYMVTYESFMSFMLSILRRVFVFMTIIFTPFEKQYQDSVWIKYVSYFIRTLFFFIPAIVGLVKIFHENIKDYMDSAKKENSLLNGFKIMSFNDSSSISTFFLILFLTVWVLYFLNLLPLGARRLNYFCVPMIGYFWLEGYSVFKKNKKKIFYTFGNIIPVIFLTSLLVFISVGYTKEALRKSGSQAVWYQTVGKAIKVAYETNATIVVPINKQKKWEHAAGWQFEFELMLKAHPYYNHEKGLEIVSMDEIENKCKNIKNEDLSFISIEENNYNIISLKDLCTQVQ